MATYATKWADAGGTGNVITADCAGDIVQNVYELDWSQAPLKGVTLALNDVVDLGPLPANHTVTDVIIDADDMDTGGSPALAFDIGVMSGTVGDTVNSRTIGNEFFAASNIAQTGGVSRMTKSAGFRVAPVGYDRSIGLKVTAAAATQASTTTGKIRIIVEMKG